MASLKNNLKRVKQSLNYLQVAYQGGLLDYPRVDNDYKRVNYSYDTAPHAPFPHLLSSIFTPLSKKEKLKVDGNEILLLLSTLDIITPAQIESTMLYLSHYVDSSLSPLSQALGEEAEKVMQTLNAVLELFNVDRRTLFEYKKELSMQTYECSEGAMMFEQPNLFFFTSDDNKKARCASWKRAINNRPGSDDLEFGGIVQVNSLSEVFQMYDKKMDEQNKEVKKVMEEMPETEFPSQTKGL